MAGNRLHWSASIFERMTGLLKGGATKHKDRPIWYDVYKAFPPKYEPTYARPAIQKDILPILYPEDAVRGKFSRLYGSPGYHDMMYAKSKSISQRFVEKYQELEKSGQFSDAEKLFEATEDYFIDEGLFEPRKEIEMNVNGKDEPSDSEKDTQ